MFSLNQQEKNSFCLILIFTLVIMLEYSTPPAYVFSYLYTGAIILTNQSFNRYAVFLVTITAAVLTILNIFLPNHYVYESSTVANRVIAVMALLVTGWLSDRHLCHKEAIARQQSQIEAQKELAAIRYDFVSTLTHDLKTPLLGAIETLKAFQSGQFGEITSIQLKVLEMMTRSHRSTLELVQTVLDIYRNDTEGIKLKCSGVNLVVIIEHVVATLTDLATSRRVPISLNYGESDFRQSLRVNGDELQLQRVFSNLIVNAINHSPRGSKVEIVLESLGNEQQVTVLDNGAGINPSELPHLFERFYQGHSDLVNNGCGLGLYLSRQIIEAHNGTIWAKNRSPSGAIFACRLPALFP